MSARLARPSDVFIAVSAAVLLHLLLFGVAVVLVAIGLFGQSERPTLPEPPAAVTVEIHPEMFERPVPAAEPEPVEEPRQRFARTAPNQESEAPPENAAYLGERNTRAGSELPPDPDGPAVPSQDGREPRRPDEANTFDSDFSPGDSAAAPAPPAEQQPPPPGDPLRKPDAPREAGEQPAEQPAEDTPPDPAERREETVRTETQIPVPKEQHEEKPQEEETLPKESEATPDPQSENQPGGAPEVTTPTEETPPPSDRGTESEVRKTKLRGSIGRKGTSALDVEDSPIGRYQAQLSRAVERKWQISCLNKRELLTPGTVTIRFLVDERGRVSGMRFLNGSADMEIELGITMSSIRDANIPAMPKEVADQLKGDPLELIYNFYF